MPFRTRPLNATIIEPTLLAPAVTSNYFMYEMAVTEETTYQDHRGKTAMKDNREQGLNGTQGAPGPQSLLGPAGPSTGGVVYTKWGNSDCPEINGTKLVYTGRAGRSFYNYQGSGAHYICLPMDPEYTLHSNAGAKVSVQSGELPNTTIQ